MALFLTILEGKSPDQAKPLFATRDRQLIRVVAQELTRRLGDNGSTGRVVHIGRDGQRDNQKVE